MRFHADPSYLPNGHLGSELLMRYLDGEVTSKESDAVKTHLGTCWQCRVELEDLEKTVSECVRYRKALFDTFPPPSAPWRDIRQGFSEVDAALGSVSFWDRIRSTVGGWGRPRLLAPAAAALALIAVGVYELNFSASARASQWLDESASRSHRPVPYEVRAGGIAVPASQVQARLRRARYDDADPLSARAFLGWRSALASKTDQVFVTAGGYRIRTIADSSDIRQATLDLDRGDFAPRRNELVFEDQVTYEFTHAPAGSPSAPVERRAERREVERSPRLTASEEVPGESKPPAALARRATAAEEIAVFTALRRLGADLGEPIEVHRRDGHITVSGVGISESLRRRLAAELGARPGVVLDFHDQAEPGVSPAGERTTTATTSRHPRIVAWQDAMAQHLGGRPALDQFGDEAVARMDLVMAHAHALRRLATHFPSEVQLALGDPARRELCGLALYHARSAAGHLNWIATRIDAPLRAAGGNARRQPAAARSWQSGAEAFFGEARQAEPALAALLTSAAFEGELDHLPSVLLARIYSLGALLTATAQDLEASQ